MIPHVIRLVTVRAISFIKSRLPITDIEDHLLVLLVPHYRYLSPARNMSPSPQKRPSSLIAPVGHVLGNKFLSLANLKSRLPVANKPKTRAPRRTFLSVAPVPFAPLVDTHAFQPPPPYSALPDDSSELLPVPHNTPEEPAWNEDTLHNGILRMSLADGQPVGLGLEGVEKCDGGRFDGLGRLSSGFRAPTTLGGTSQHGEGAGHELRQQVHKLLSEHSKRRRTRASEQPKKRHDVFYATTGGQENRQVVPAKAVKLRIRRKSVASPTPPPRAGDVRVSRGTISSELKRAASLERRASLAEVTNIWRG